MATADPDLKQEDKFLKFKKQLMDGLEENLKCSKGLIIWSLLSRRLYVATTTKPNLGHLASASPSSTAMTRMYLSSVLANILKAIMKI
jgi:hypothetical protein